MLVCRGPAFFSSSQVSCSLAQPKFILNRARRAHFHASEALRSDEFEEFDPSSEAMWQQNSSQQQQQQQQQQRQWRQGYQGYSSQQNWGNQPQWRNSNQYQSNNWRNSQNQPQGVHHPQQQQQQQWTNQNWGNFPAAQHYQVYNQARPWTGNYQETQSFQARGQQNYNRGDGRVQGNPWNYQRSWQNQRSWPSQERKPQRQVDDARYWLDSSDRATSLEEKFLFLSYNILSADNAREHYRDLYYHIPMRFVKWEWRKGRLVREIEHWSPDVVCLQEVDRFDDLQNDLKKNGYAGIYKHRTGEATDGCAIFWKESRFLLLEEDSIEFKEYGLRDNVAQFCILKSITSKATYEAAVNGETTGSENKCIVVANTHVLFNPKRGDIKLGQVRNILQTAHELSKAWGGAEVVLAGDFNSTPSSPLYRFLSTSGLDVSSLHRTEISGQLAAGEGHQPFRPFQKTWFRSPTWRASDSLQTKTTTQQDSSTVSSSGAGEIQQEVEVIVEKTASLLEVREEQVLSVESDASIQEQVSVSEAGAEVHSDQTSKDLMVLKETSSELMLVASDQKSDSHSEEVCSQPEEVPSSGTWIREIHSEESWGVEEKKKVSFAGDDDDREDERNEPVSQQQLELQRILPCGWSVEELLNATGSLDSTKLSHKLNLRSAYSGIEGKPGSRDASGEPRATTYHKKFMGTVDYIWHTEGLRPVRVLDLLPVDALRQTGGLPSQKWGSDHLALVCELEFIEDKN